MNIKFFLIILSVLVFKIAISQDQKNVKIQGKLNNANSIDQISILDFMGKNPPLASSKISEDGSFEIETFLENPSIYKLQIDDKNFISLILEPDDNLTITADADNLKNNLNISGSEQNALLYQTGNNVNIFELKLDSISKEFNEARKNGANLKELTPIREKYSKVNEEKISYITSFIENNPGSLACLFFIDKLDISKNFETFEILDKSLYSKYPENTYINNLHNKVEIERKLAIGSVAPELKLPDPDSNLISLSSLRGNIVLVDFWAAWCGPCRKENPNIVRLYEQYKNEGFEIYGVSLDKSRKSWLDAIENDNITWTQVSDLKFWDSEAAKTYQVKSIPYTVLLNREGRIIAKKLRGKALEEKLRELFEE